MSHLVLLGVGLGVRANALGAAGVLALLASWRVDTLGVRVASITVSIPENDNDGDDRNKAKSVGNPLQRAINQGKGLKAST